MGVRDELGSLASTCAGTTIDIMLEFYIRKRNCEVILYLGPRHIRRFSEVKINIKFYFIFRSFSYDQKRYEVSSICHKFISYANEYWGFIHMT